MTRLFIDADACPVREETYRVASRYELAVVVVHNGSRPIRPPPCQPGQPGVQIVVVPDTPDAADDWIAERIAAGDICVTADIPLAHRCLARRASAIGHSGRLWTSDNIGGALAGRDIARHLREIGAGGGGHAALTAADRSRFSSALDGEIVRLQRELRRRAAAPSARPPGRP